MRRRNFILAATTVLTASHAEAGDPSAVEIIGLTPGMSIDAARTRLAIQGYSVTRDGDTLRTRTRDGWLSAELASGGWVREIRYVFAGRGAGEADAIRQYLVERFGVPERVEPMVWCHQGHGGCAEEQAAAVYREDTLTLIVRGGR